MWDEQERHVAAADDYFYYYATNMVVNICYLFEAIAITSVLWFQILFMNNERNGILSPANNQF